ncbi:MAG: DUF3181 family protein [Nodosilinea sp.]
MANSGTAKAIEDLAAAIGDKAYLDVAKWHLYLGDAKLHTSLAEKLYPVLGDGEITAAAVADILRSTLVAIGGGQKTVPLFDLMPTASQADLVTALEEYQRDL